MSRGLGDTQRALLSELAASEDLALTTAELAELLHRNPRQVRTAVDSLVKRGLVMTTLAVVDWKGDGQYGSFTYGHNRDEADMGAPAGVIRKGEPLLHSTRLARADMPYWHQGMPTFGRYVWLSVNRARHLIGRWERSWARATRQARAALPQSAVAAARTDYEAMEAACELAGVPTPERPEWLGPGRGEPRA